MSKKNMLSLGVFVLFLFAVVSLSMADDIKQRMKERLPVIVQMKQQGLVGENSKGYLEYVTSARPNPQIVDAENSDRKKVYSIIAKQQGATIDKVEQLRALQIVQKAAKGEFLQKADGTWYQK
ncbi:YdbL family protein [Desulfamplus magnetovallimortis]|nr:YdbL family protein [Desulfamplus magnetovallimortis]